MYETARKGGLGLWPTTPENKTPAEAGVRT
jgi:hypothetical protein